MAPSTRVLSFPGLDQQLKHANPLNMSVSRISEKKLETTEIQLETHAAPPTVTSV